MGSSIEMSSDLPMPVYTPTHIQTQSSHIDPAGSVVEPGLTVAGKVQLISASLLAPSVLATLVSATSPYVCLHSRAFARSLLEVLPPTSVLLTHCLSQGLFPDLSACYILMSLPSLVLCCLALAVSCFCHPQLYPKF